MGRRGPRQRRKCGEAALRQNPQGQSLLAGGADPTRPCGGAHQGTHLSALYRHLAARRGKQRAIMAVAHSIMRSVFHMLSRNEPSRELGGTILTSGGGTTQWIGSPDGLNISGTMCPLNWRRRSWREKFSRQSGVVLLEEAREPHRCHQSIYLSLPPDKSGSVK